MIRSGEAILTIAVLATMKWTAIATTANITRIGGISLDHGCVYHEYNDHLDSLLSIVIDFHC